MFLRFPMLELKNFIKIVFDGSLKHDCFVERKIFALNCFLQIYGYFFYKKVKKYLLGLR